MPGAGPVPARALPQLLAGYAGPPEALDPLLGMPLLVVDLEGAGTVDLAPLRSRPACVVIGIHRAAEPLPDVPAELVDVLLCPVTGPPAPWVGVPDVDAAVATVAAAVRAAPQAATALVQLLRLAERLAPADAVVAESFAYATLQAGAEHRAWLAGRTPRRRRGSGGPAVLVERRGETLLLTLNRPEVRNAYDATVRDGLAEGFRLALADDGLRHIELHGSGPDFCAGGDLTEFGTTPDPVTAHLVRTTAGAAPPLLAVADRVTVHLHGNCIGAGIEVPAFAARVLAAPDTVLRLPEIGMGLIPGAGGTVSITRRIGRHRTGWLALTGQPLPALQARDWGLVDEVRPVPG